MWLLISLILQVFHFINSNQFDYPVKGPERSDPINLQIFIPCLKGVYDEEYGFFDPLFFVLYQFALPPIAVCPQLSSKKTLRCLALNLKKPDKIVPCAGIEPKSRVCIHIHAYLAEYDESLSILTALTCSREYDWAILLDWARLADPRVFGRVRIPIINAFLGLSNTILGGRITCDLVRYLEKEKKVDPKDVFTVSFLGGTQFLSPMAEYCRVKYGIRFNHMVAIDLPSIPYRRSNYPLVNRTSAKFVDVIFTTKAPNIPFIDEIFAGFSHFGFFEVDADCVYYANPKRLLLEQEPCMIMPGTPCSHIFAVFVYISAYSGRCLYRYGPCPDLIIQQFSNREVGLTRLNCADHPFLERTCFETSSNPIKSC